MNECGCGGEEKKGREREESKDSLIYGVGGAA